MEAISTERSGIEAKETGQDDLFGNNAYNSGIIALLSIRNFSQVLETDYVQMIKIEKELNQRSHHALSVIETHAPAELKEKWIDILTGVNAELIALNTVLHAAGERVSKETVSDSGDLWKQFDIHLEALKKEYTRLKDFGVQILPVTEHLHWNNEIFNEESSPLTMVVSHAELCRLKLQMLEKYSPEELSSINKMILDHIPADFNFEEAYNYQKKYLDALVDFTNELKSEKNLWDKFLDVLAGGTHQPPSEHVMMKKWLEGEKGDL